MPDVLLTLAPSGGRVFLPSLHIGDSGEYGPVNTVAACGHAARRSSSLRPVVSAASSAVSSAFPTLR